MTAVLPKTGAQQNKWSAGLTAHKLIINQNRLLAIQADRATRAITPKCRAGQIPGLAPPPPRIPAPGSPPAEQGELPGILLFTGGEEARGDTENGVFRFDAIGLRTGHRPCVKRGHISANYFAHKIEQTSYSIEVIPDVLTRGTAPGGDCGGFRQQPEGERGRPGFARIQSAEFKVLSLKHSLFQEVGHAAINSKLKTEN